MNLTTNVDLKQSVFLTSMLIGFSLPHKLNPSLVRHLRDCGLRYGVSFILGLLIGALIGRLYPGKEVSIDE